MEATAGGVPRQVGESSHSLAASATQRPGAARPVAPAAMYPPASSFTKRQSFVDAAITNLANRAPSLAQTAYSALGGLPLAAGPPVMVGPSYGYHASSSSSSASNLSSGRYLQQHGPPVSSAAGGINVGSGSRRVIGWGTKLTVRKPGGELSVETYLAPHVKMAMSAKQPVTIVMVEAPPAAVKQRPDGSSEWEMPLTITHDLLPLCTCYMAVSS